MPNGPIAILGGSTGNGPQSIGNGKSIPWFVTRYLRRNEATTDYGIIPTATLSGDFSGSIDFSSITATQSSIFTGSLTGVSSLVLDITVGGALRFFAFNSSGALQGIATVSGAFNDGAIHTAYFSLVGTVASVSVDDGAASTAEWNSMGGVNIGNIYRTADGTRKFSGILANLKIYDAGVLVRDYPINDNSNILANKATVLGDELLNASDLDSNLSSSVVNQTYKFESIAAFQRMLNVPSLSLIGKTFYVSVSATVSSGSATVIVGDSSRVFSSNESAIYLVNPAANDYIRVNSGGGGFDGELTISIRQADGFGSIVNGTADQWQLYQKQPTGEWLGPELVVNGGFDTDSDWSKGVGWSISNGTANLVNSASDLNQSIVLTSGLTYRTAFNTLNHSSGDFRIRFTGGAAAANGTTRNANGIYHEDLTALDSNSLIRIDSLNGVSLFSVDNVSVKEALNVA